MNTLNTEHVVYTCIYIPDKPPSISIFLDELDDCTADKADLVVARCLVGRHADVAGTNWRNKEKEIEGLKQAL